MKPIDSSNPFLNLIKGDTSPEALAVMLKKIMDMKGSNVPKPDKTCTLCQEGCYADEHICPTCYGYNFQNIIVK